MSDTLFVPAPSDLTESGHTLETATPLEILRWASDEFGSRLTFATGFGVEGCVLIDLIGRHRLPIDVFTLDTGLLFPETYDLWRRFENRYELTIRGIHPKLSVDEQAVEHGPQLWGRIPDVPVTRSHPPASWPSAANSSICRTYRKTAGEESRRRSPVANRWMRP